MGNSKESPGLYSGEICCITVFVYFNFGFTERTGDIGSNISWDDPNALTEADLSRVVLELSSKILKKRGDSSLFSLPVQVQSG